MSDRQKDFQQMMCSFLAAKALVGCNGWSVGCLLKDLVCYVVGVSVKFQICISDGNRIFYLTVATLCIHWIWSRWIG